MLLSFLPTPTEIGHLSQDARLLTAFCGMAMFGWSLMKLRRRSALVPTCSLFLTIGSLFMAFSVLPSAFDRLSYALGVHYPPVLYLIGCVFVLILLIVHLATRLSSVDERCRRLAQEIALHQFVVNPNPRDEMFHASNGKDAN